MVLKESSRTGELAPGSNKWIRRRSTGSRQIYDSIVTLFGKRLLQERLAKSSAKAKELQLQSTSRR
ncbi:unnamed protein product [Brassica oleracea var. botrytis]|uniref:Uncharacterized protein n=1 Tax=Brassica oleracea TaxID=3712 RepID=A0A3P6EAK3_BRAOL|nr:unnamed protein product [Brassica oleracea]